MTNAKYIAAAMQAIIEGKEVGYLCPTHRAMIIAWRELAEKVISVFGGSQFVLIPTKRSIMFAENGGRARFFCIENEFRGLEFNLVIADDFGEYPKGIGDLWECAKRDLALRVRS